MQSILKLSRCAATALLPVLVIIFLPGCRKEAPHERAAVRVSTMVAGGATSAAGDEESGYSGTVEASTGSDLSFADAGTVRRVYVEVGDKVKRGQLLADLDNVELNGALEIAEAELEQARDAYRRLEMLHNAKALPEIKWVEMKSKLHQAESAVTIARKALDNARLYAPETSVVAARMIEPGMNVLPGVPVLRVVTAGNLKAVISVPENAIGCFAKGQGCDISAEGIDSAAWRGTLVEKGVEADPLTREYKVKYRVEGNARALLPGMVCTVRPDKGAGEPAAVSSEIVLPERAVLLDFDNRSFVWLKADGKAFKRYVTVKGLSPAGVIISEGLSPADSVIVDGMQKVSGGMAVTDVPTDK